jgi:hypothetical protein
VAHLYKSTVDEDLRLKILQAADEVDRTVAIQQKFVGAGAAPSQ